MPVKGALSQAVSSAASQEHQAWILRRFLTQVEGQEAADEEEPRSIFEEFAVSQVFCCISFWMKLPDAAVKVHYHLQTTGFGNKLAQKGTKTKQFCSSGTSMKSWY